MSVEYEVIISKHGSLISMKKDIKTMEEALKVKENLLNGPFSGKYISIEKTVTTEVFNTPFEGVDLTY